MLDGIQGGIIDSVMMPFTFMLKIIMALKDYWSSDVLGRLRRYVCRSCLVVGVVVPGCVVAGGCSVWPVLVLVCLVGVST